jgi:hypothetical protein
MHDVRVMWLKASEANGVPAQLERATLTPASAVKGITSSCAALDALIETSSKGDGRPP